MENTESNEPSQEIFPKHSHEEMYLIWNHQGDGFYYFECSICRWKKPDMGCPVIQKEFKAQDRQALKDKDEEIKGLEWVLSSASDLLAVSFCGCGDFTGDLDGSEQICEFCRLKEALAQHAPKEEK